MGRSYRSYWCAEGHSKVRYGRWRDRLVFASIVINVYEKCRGNAKSFGAIYTFHFLGNAF